MSAREVQIMSSEHDNKNVISYDVDIDDSTPTIDIEVEPKSNKKRSKLDTIIEVANKVSEKAKVKRAAKLQASIDKLRQENPGYSFMFYKCERDSNFIRRTSTGAEIYYPICKYNFTTLENELLYYAAIHELEKQNITIKRNGIVVSNILEINHAMKKPTFKIVVNGKICGELVRASKEKGVDFYFGKWKIRAFLNGYFEIFTNDGYPISKVECVSTKDVIQYLSTEDEILIASLAIAVSAYNNSQKRKRNRHSPYVKIFSGGG